MSWEVVVLATKDAPARRLKVDRPTPRKVLRASGINLGDLWLCHGDHIVDLDAEMNSKACFSGSWWYGASPSNDGITRPLFLVKSPADSQEYLNFMTMFKSVSTFIERVFAGV